MKGLAQTGWIGLGGALGAIVRYQLGGWVARRFGEGFPWGTLVINVTGSFLLGLLLGRIVDRAAGPACLRPLLAIGFLGAYTTFSTFEYETLRLAESGSLQRAFANAAGSVALGFLAVWLGLRLARSF